MSVKLKCRSFLAPGLRGHIISQTSHQSGERRTPGSVRGLRPQLHHHRPRLGPGRQRGSGLLPRPPDCHQDGKHPGGQLRSLPQRHGPRHPPETEHQVGVGVRLTETVLVF